MHGAVVAAGTRGRRDVNEEQQGHGVSGIAAEEMVCGG